MNKLTKKSVSILLAVLMLLTVAPMTIFAADDVSNCNHYNSWKMLDKQEPTCEEDGHEEGLYCETCQKFIKDGDTIKKRGHDYKKDEALSKTATCTEAGYDFYKCTRCDATKKENEVAAKGHDLNETTTPATCTVPGSKVTTCSRCDYSATETIPASHKYEETVVDATCTTGGYKYYECSVCHQNYTTNEVDPLGHDFDGVEWSTVTESSCDKAGLKQRTCKREGCGYVDEVVITAGKHDFKTEVKTPTCTEPGYTKKTCKICKIEILENEKPALGHDVEYIDEEEATCYREGHSDYRYCKRCKTNLTEPIILAKKDHKIIYTDPIAPTCNNPGTTAGSQCEFCGKIFDEITEIPSLGHNYIEDVQQEATCTNEGLSFFKCDRCGESYQAVTDPKGHDFDKQWTIDVKETCTEPGIKSRYCKRCGIQTDVTEINDLGGKHQWKTEWTIDQTPTCTKQGLKSHHCAICDEKTDITAIPIKHKYVTTTAKATLKKNGEIKTVCSVCNKESSTKAIAKIGSITLSKTSYVYDGKTKTPKVTVKDINGKTLVKGTDYTVKSDSGRKKVGSYKVTVTLKGNYSGEKTLTFKITLGKVTGVKITANKGKNTAKLTWTKLSGAQKYVIYYATKKDGTYKKLGTTTKTSYTTKKFTAGKTLYFKVRPYTVNNNGKGAYGTYSSVVKVKIK